MLSNAEVIAVKSLSRKKHHIKKSTTILFLLSIVSGYLVYEVDRIDTIQSDRTPIIESVSIHR